MQNKGARAEKESLKEFIEETKTPRLCRSRKQKFTKADITNIVRTINNISP